MSCPPTGYVAALSSFRLFFFNYTSTTYIYTLSLHDALPIYGTLDFVGYPRFPAPVEFIAAVIAYYVHPVNIQTACLIMEGAEFTENIINGVSNKLNRSRKRSEERFSRNAETDLVCRLLLEKK